MFELVEEGREKASTHMMRDREMLEQGSMLPLLTFYQWDSFCITYGLFAHPENFLNMDFCKKEGIEVVQRPTGGGIFFHECDFPFSLFFPEEYTHSFESIWKGIQKSLVSLVCDFLSETPDAEYPSLPIEGRFCQAGIHGCDFVWGGKKFGGAAFRKSKKGILCQASLFCSPFSWDKSALFVKQPCVLHMMKHVSMCLEEDIKTELQDRITLAVEENL